MLRHMESWSLVQSNSQTHANKGEGREIASTSKDRSRPGKEPMGAEEAPKSWYEPVRRPNFEEEIPFVRQSREDNVPKTKGTFRGPHNDSLFEPIFDGQEGEIKSKNGYFMHDEYNYAQNYSYPGEGTCMKSFKQVPEIPRQADIPKVKRANYLIFKDLDRQRAYFFSKRMEQKALNQNNQGRPWMATNQNKEERPWLASKRNTPTSPAPPTSKREYPPQKRVNTEKEVEPQGVQEVLQE
ncbi:hypothetical protein RHGRI_030778 [Rhododendron griersonianum]|uniref:Uncharacterized protein n=1 Tax=Rhododendron griersonianum TaxID=479676 RepID=A0AAV6I5V3_9ERIC|nr:hypothetical protein RHGRI_030778 [Rhododendron griersonianum]